MQAEKDDVVGMIDVVESDLVRLEANNKYDDTSAQKGQDIDEYNTKN